MPDSAAQDERVQAERQRLVEARRQQGEQLDAHVREIQAARAELETKLQSLVQSCERFHQVIRRTPMDDVTVRYRVYHAMQTRMAGALHQALQRAQGTDRMLSRGRAASEEQERQQREAEMQSKVRAAVKEVYDLQLPKDNDFEELFGENEEEVSDAS